MTTINDASPIETTTSEDDQALVAGGHVHSPNYARRIPWDEYFMEHAVLAAKRATCTRAHVGAVLVRNRRVLATGYNGAPSGQPHCDEVGCLVYESITPTGDTELNCWRTIHAEMNAIASAAQHGIAIAGATIYVTHSPCFHCMKVLLNTGIERVVFEKPYKLDTLEPLLRTGAVIFDQFVPSK